MKMFWLYKKLPQCFRNKVHFDIEMILLQNCPVICDSLSSMKYVINKIILVQNCPVNLNSFFKQEIEINL